MGSEKAQDTGHGDEARKPYEKPAWEEEQTFERAALQCAKEADCKLNQS